MDDRSTWRVDDFVAERAVYLGEPFEVWEGQRASDGVPILLLVGGGPQQSNDTLMRELFLDVDGVAPLLAVVHSKHGAYGDAGQARQVLVVRRPTGTALVDLAPQPEPVVAQLMYDLATIAVDAQRKGLALTGLCPDLCFASEVDGRLRIRGVAPRMAGFTMRTRNGEFARPMFDGMYMPMEVIAGTPTGPGSASFSIGLIGAFLATGRHPCPLEPPYMPAILTFLQTVPVRIAAGPALAEAVRASTASALADRVPPDRLQQRLAPLVDDPPPPDARQRPPRVPPPAKPVPRPWTDPPRRQRAPVDAHFLYHAERHEFRPPEDRSLRGLELVLEALHGFAEPLGLEVEVGARNLAHDYIDDDYERAPHGVFVRVDGYDDDVARPDYSAEIWRRPGLDAQVLHDIEQWLGRLEPLDAESEPHWSTATLGTFAMRLPDPDALAGRTEYRTDNDGADDVFEIRWRDGQAWCVPRRLLGPLMTIALYADGGLRVDVAVSTWAGDDAPGRADLRAFFSRLRERGFDPA